MEKFEKDEIDSDYIKPTPLKIQQGQFCGSHSVT